MSAPPNMSVTTLQKNLKKYFCPGFVKSYTITNSLSNTQKLLGTLQTCEVLV